MTPIHTTIDSPLGELTLVAEGEKLSGIYFPGHWTRPDRRAFGPHREGGFERAAAQLDEDFTGERESFDLQRIARGDSFQVRVWKLLDEIPYGETSTYGELAAELGDPALARAVGRAVGSNPLSIVCPCHRVLGKGGKLTGYAGGLDRKRHLLELEAPAARAMEPTLFEAASGTA